jgi:hypothetical protein
MEILFQAGSPIDFQLEAPIRVTPAGVATKKGYLDGLRWLLENGCDLKEGRYLHKERAGWCEEVVEDLVTTAVRDLNYPVVKFLIDVGGCNADGPPDAPITPAALVNPNPVQGQKRTKEEMHKRRLIYNFLLKRGAAPPMFFDEDYGYDYSDWECGCDWCMYRLYGAEYFNEPECEDDHRSADLHERQLNKKGGGGFRRK